MGVKGSKTFKVAKTERLDLRLHILKYLSKVAVCDL